MDKLKMHSPDFVKQNNERIAEIFPNCVTESRADDSTLKLSIDFDLLRQELSDSVVEGPTERYQLNWPGKREALIAANSAIAKTLRPVRSESVDFDSTSHLFIEGDNLDALKLLQENYLEKVKLVFIDPPYNTGGDFIYEDDFSIDASTYLVRSNQKDARENRLVANLESNGRFHSDWLTMLYPRLKLARNLLRQDGSIFVSIDGNEASNLQLVLDEIFGRSNCVTQIVWQKRVSPANDAKWFSSDHDMILVYAKNKDIWRPNRLERTIDQLAYYKNPDRDPKGPWNSATYTCNKSRSERPNLYYPIRNPNTGQEVWPKETAVWKYGLAVTEKHIAEERLYWGSNGLASFPRIKLYLSEMENVVPRTVWSSDEAGHTQQATTELKEMFDGTNVFDSPKPVKLLKRILDIGTSGNADIVLDFFAGSGTTAHSVLTKCANNEQLRFIVVQMPEAVQSSLYPNIAEIAKERIRRAGKKLKEENAITASSLDVGFRVLKVDTSNMKDVYYQPDATKQSDLFSLVDNIKEDRTSEDLLFQVLLDWGVDLSLSIAREKIGGHEVFFVDGNALAACFDKDLSEETIKGIASRKPIRAVFRDASFSNDSAKINIEQVFKYHSPGTELRCI